jgi:hypothetical protein
VFLSPDPFIQAPHYTQSHHRYSTTFNNPLKYTDPSGYTAVYAELPSNMNNGGLGGFGGLNTLNGFAGFGEVQSPYFDPDPNRPSRTESICPANPSDCTVWHYLWGEEPKSIPDPFGIEKPPHPTPTLDNNNNNGTTSSEPGTNCEGMKRFQCSEYKSQNGVQADIDETGRQVRESLKEVAKEYGPEAALAVAPVGWLGRLGRVLKGWFSKSAVDKAAEKAAKGVAPAIKAGAVGGETAGKPFAQAIRDAAKAENPLQVCVYCRREGVATQVDHAIPRARGGNATLDNAQLACPHCNASKGARDFPVNSPPGYRGEWPPSHWGP